MKSVTIKLVLLSTLFLKGTLVSASVVFPGYIDDFENGTTNSWVMGPKANSDLAPKNLANEDESNRFLKVNSFGEGANGRDAGSRMVFYNENQWTGDFSQIGSISLNVKAESSTEEYLYMRLAIYDTAATGVYSRYVSTQHQPLKADGAWHLINLSLAAEDLTRFRGEESADEVLRNVSHLRILSSKDNISGWGVDKISATLSIDNITAMPTIPQNQVITTVPLPASFWFMLSALMGILKISIKVKD